MVIIYFSKPSISYLKERYVHIYSLSFSSLSLCVPSVHVRDSPLVVSLISLIISVSGYFLYRLIANYILAQCKHKEGLWSVLITLFTICCSQFTSRINTLPFDFQDTKHHSSCFTSNFFSFINLFILAYVLGQVKPLESH